MENSDKNSEQSKQPDNAGKTSQNTPDNVSNNNSPDSEKVAKQAESAASKDSAKVENSKKESVKSGTEKMQSTQADKPAAPQKSGGGKFATVMSLLALGVGGTSMYMQVQPDAKIPFLSDKISTSTQADTASVDITELESKMAAFDSRLASLSESNATQPDQVDDTQVEKLAQQITQLQQRIAQQANNTGAGTNNNVAQLQQSQQQLTQQLQQVRQENQRLTQALGELQQQQSTLSVSVDQVTSQIPSTQDQAVWVLRDVELTLKQANRRLNTVNDIESVLPLMKSAQNQLLELRRPELSEVNNTLQQEIQALEAIKVPAKTEMLRALNALAEQATILPLQGENTFEQLKAASQAKQKSATDKVADAGAGLLNSLTDMIQSEKDQQQIRPLVSNELRELVRQRTQLVLESASAAFISADYELFVQRLSTAKDWVNKHFDINAEVTQSWLQEIEMLESSAPQESVPDISQSLQSVSQALNLGG